MRITVLGRGCLVHLGPRASLVMLDGQVMGDRKKTSWFRPLRSQQTQPVLTGVAKTKISTNMKRVTPA